LFPTQSPFLFYLSRARAQRAWEKRQRQEHAQRVWEESLRHEHAGRVWEESLRQDEEQRSGRMPAPKVCTLHTDWVKKHAPWASTVHYMYTVKKKLAIFAFPAGMSLTKLYMAGNNLIIHG
jgi:hypothetical protein